MNECTSLLRIKMSGLQLGCANPPLSLNVISASILSGDQYINEYWKINCFRQKIILGVPQKGSTLKKVDFQSSRNNMFWVV